MDGVSDVAHTIQLAVAPVFLLAGIGALLSVVTARLGRAVDRARDLEGRLSGESPPDAAAAARMRNELQVLDRRMVLAQRAIALCTIAELFVCFVVAALFLSTLSGVNAGGAVAVLFIAAMAALTVGLGLFLAEVTLATRMLRVRAELLMND